MFLYALKLLADRHVIVWQPSKTNHDYTYEIKSDDYRDRFAELGYYFEYVWYGDFHADTTHYSAMKQALATLKEKLKNNA